MNILFSFFVLSFLFALFAFYTISKKISKREHRFSSKEYFAITYLCIFSVVSLTLLLYTFYNNSENKNLYEINSDKEILSKITFDRTVTVYDIYDIEDEIKHHVSYVYLLENGQEIGLKTEQHEYVSKQTEDINYQIIYNKDVKPYEYSLNGAMPQINNGYELIEPHTIKISQ